MLTNFSSHWHGGEITESGERFLVLPFFPQIALPGPETDRVWESVSQYGLLPSG